MKKGGNLEVEGKRIGKRERIIKEGFDRKSNGEKKENEQIKEKGI